MGSARGLVRAAMRTAIRHQQQSRLSHGSHNHRGKLSGHQPPYQRHQRCGRAFCSYGYPQEAGPTEVQWTKERANSIQLIGNVGKDPQVKYLETGNVVANLSLAVRQRTLQRNNTGGGGAFPGSAGDESTTSWYNVEMWGELARQAEQHVRKGRQLYIEGSIKMDTWFDRKTETQKMSPKIVARVFHFVAPYNAMNYGGGADFNSNGGANSASSQPNAPAQSSQQQAYASPANTEDMWRALFANPQDYFDNRNSKINEKQPDFKSAKTGAALWLTSRNTPDWVFDEIAMRESDGNFNCIRTNRNRSTADDK